MKSIASFFNKLSSRPLNEIGCNTSYCLFSNSNVLTQKVNDTLSYDLKKDSKKNTAIIVGYYNGITYLPEQVRSILEQSHENLEIFVSDDCSSVKVDINKLGLTLDNIKKIRLGVRSSNIGFTKNFLDALANVDNSFEYFAFSDQDDIWHQDKIADALEAIARYSDNEPVLYCARTDIISEDCQTNLGISPRIEKPPSFANALVQNIGGGNTMVFNKAARDLIVKSSVNVDVVSHDWWCYQIVSGAEGIVHYDPRPCLKYRQHSNNLVGSCNGWTARFTRFKGLFKFKFRRWNDTNLKALSKNRALLTPDNQQRLDDFITARESALIKRLILFKRTGIYRQTLLGNIGLLLAIILNKV